MAHHDGSQRGDHIGGGRGDGNQAGDIPEAAPMAV